MWEIKYENDTGFNDETFTEWWEVTNGEKSFVSKSKKDAEWLYATLIHWEMLDGVFKQLIKTD